MPPPLSNDVQTMLAVGREAPLRFLRTAFQPDAWVAIFLKSYETGSVTQRVGPAGLGDTYRELLG